MKTVKYILILFLFTFFCHSLKAQDIHQHQQWNELLNANVTAEGDVDYKAFIKQKETLKFYLDLLGANPPKPTWTQAEKKAYLINAYNAFTVKLIIDHYPTESIRAIGGFLNNPFSTEFAKIGEKVFSLDDIEKGMLLPMGDPRVHFAVNCASESCPKLADEAFLASTLDQQLEKAAHSFINSDKNKLSATKVELSKIFKWYASDFETEDRSVIDYINQYATIKINEEASIDYLPYSWKLNEK